MGWCCWRACATLTLHRERQGKFPQEELARALRPRILRLVQRVGAVPTHPQVRSPVALLPSIVVERPAVRPCPAGPPIVRLPRGIAAAEWERPRNLGSPALGVQRPSASWLTLRTARVGVRRCGASPPPRAGRSGRSSARCVSRQLLHRGDVRARVQEVADEGAPQVVGLTAHRASRASSSPTRSAPRLRLPGRAPPGPARSPRPACSAARGCGEGFRRRSNSRRAR